jgi:hypothetical protein
VRGPAGSHYLIYSFARGARVGNAFIESLVGLWDYSSIAGDANAKALFQRGDAEAHWELPRLDTGAWTLYQLGGAESDLNYQRAIRDFVRNLCDRTQAPLYCQAAERFTAYLSQRPEIAIAGPPKARARKVARIAIRVSKISCLTIAIYKGAKLVYRATWYFPHGTHSFPWQPRTPGDYTVKVLARDLVNHEARTEAPLRVLKPGKPKKGKP